MSDTGGPAPARSAGAAPAVQTSLAGMWERFREQLSAQVSVLEMAAMAVLSDDLGPELADRALREAHKLAGSLGTLGMPRGSAVAREIESWFGSGEHRDPAAMLRLSDAVAALRRCVEVGPATGPAMNGSPQGGSGAPFLLFVGDDPALADGLTREAHVRGLGLEVVIEVGAARQLLDARQPEAVLVEAAGAATEAAFALMAELKASAATVPVVVLTRADTFVDRVEAARLGARGFLQQPITAADVVLAVGEIIDRARADAATVLTVDDDPIVLAALGALLAPQGQRVITLDEPLRFWETLRATSPDLVVLDVDMPEVNGIEMCQVMRADPQWSRLPMVFLTAKTDTATVEALFAAGQTTMSPNRSSPPS